MSKFHNTSTELDAWASAFGARTDAEAIAVINRLQGHINDAAADLKVCFKQMPDGVGRAKLTHEVLSSLATGIRNIEESARFLGQIKQAFARHERGES